MHTLATISMNCIFHFLSDVVLLERRANVFPFPLVFPFPHFPQPPIFQEVLVSGGGGTFATFFPELPFPHFQTPYFPQPIIFLWVLGGGTLVSDFS